MNVSVKNLAADIEVPDIYFDPGYGRACVAGTSDEWLTVISEEHNWHLPLIVRRLSHGVNDAISPYGYSGIAVDPTLSAATVSTLWSETTSLLRDLDIVSAFLRHSPLVHQAPLPEALDPHPVVEGHTTFAVDTTDPEEGWARLEGRGRTAVRKARRSGFAASTRRANCADMHVGSGFRRLYEATMTRVAASAYYLFDDVYYQNLLKHVGENLLITEVRNTEGDIKAAGLFLRHGHTLHYHLAGSDPAAARLGANTLLLWATIENASGFGCRLLHLGGGITNEDSLYKFKRSFGGRSLTYAATGLIFDAQEYARLTEHHLSRSPTRGYTRSMETFFPAYRGPST